MQGRKEIMSHTATVAEETAGTVTAEDLTVELHALGLTGCIDRLTAPLRRHGVLIRWEIPHHGIEISSASGVLLYRAAQEALSNVLRHSHATEVTVRLGAVFHGVRLTATDNGVGYNPEEQAHRGSNHGRLDRVPPSFRNDPERQPYRPGQLDPATVACLQGVNTHDHN